jgi:hypothetical protein
MVKSERRGGREREEKSAAPPHAGSKGLGSLQKAPPNRAHFNTPKTRIHLYPAVLGMDLCWALTMANTDIAHLWVMEEF